jgi:ATP-dependent Clp protease adaptor protein ClpS
MPEDPKTKPNHGDETALKERPKVEQPRLYKVIFHNDDYTTMEFVMDALRQFFKKSESEAFHIMITVHKRGSAVAARYTRDVAETKVQEVMKHAREAGMPLLVTCEPD